MWAALMTLSPAAPSKATWGISWYSPLDVVFSKSPRSHLWHHHFKHLCCVLSDAVTSIFPFIAFDLFLSSSYPCAFSSVSHPWLLPLLGISEWALAFPNNGWCWHRRQMWSFFSSHRNAFFCLTFPNPFQYKIVEIICH